MSPLSEMQHKILVELAKKPFSTRQEISNATNRSVSSLNQVIPGLKALGALKEGLIIDPDWNPLQKYFIFVETSPPAKAGASYQRGFVSRVETTLRDNRSYGDHLFLEDIEIVMGADWDIILILRSRTFLHVARFVTEYLRLQPEVSGTRTSQVLLKENPRIRERNPASEDGG